MNTYIKGENQGYNVLESNIYRYKSITLYRNHLISYMIQGDFFLYGDKYRCNMTRVVLNFLSYFV